jgi:hypothetical protein
MTTKMSNIARATMTWLVALIATVMAIPSGRAQVSYPSGGSGVAANSPLPAATSGPGPVFNVQNYGAKADAQLSPNCNTNGTTNLNCTDITFTAANIGQRVSCHANGGGLLFATPTTFTAFVDSHNMTMAASVGAFSATCMFGTNNDAALAAAQTAALAQMHSLINGTLGSSTAAPTLYFPAGAYSFLNGGISVIPNASFGGAGSGFGVKGDGVDQTKLYWHTAASNAAGAAITCTSSTQNLILQGLTLDGGALVQNFSNAAVFTSCGVMIRDVRVANFTNNTGVLAIGTIFSFNLNTTGNVIGVQVNGGGEMYATGTSNNGTNLIVQNTTGENGGSGFRFVNGLVDECGSLTACTVIQNSQDVWFIGGAFFGAPNGTAAITVDGQSFLHINGGILGSFGTDNNVPGLVISAGGTVQASDVRFVSTGTAKCINNSGRLNDNGGSSCESMFTVASGTSTGTAAVLTVTSRGANVTANCSVGDALIVEGVTPQLYNGYFPAGATTGITATGALTISYTTIGSNIGAAGAGGVAFCRNLQTYTGTLPVALLNNPIPNTCYVTITPIVNATTYTLCNFFLGSATNINHIKASSQVTTTCATAPIITISDGTVSETMTLTTAKNSWDSSVDTSTGVGTTIFKPNGTITVKYDVGTASACATPPTQLSVSYNVTPILSN